MSQSRFPLSVAPFSIRVEDEVLADLRVRIRNTRWPDQAPGGAWEQGTDREYLRHMLAFWAAGFDWRAQERELNAFPPVRDDVEVVANRLRLRRGPPRSRVPPTSTTGGPSGSRR